LPFANFRFAHFAQGMHSTRRILLCKTCKLSQSLFSKSSATLMCSFPTIGCSGWLKTHTGSWAVFLELLSSSTVSLSAYPKCTLSPMLNKITKLFICSFKTAYGFMVFLFTLCNITNNLIANKPSGKNMPNLSYIQKNYIPSTLKIYQNFQIWHICIPVGWQH